VEDYLRSSGAMLEVCGARMVLAGARNRKLLSTLETELGTACARELPPTVATSTPVDDVSPDALALVQFSSGTTDAPKAVALTHAQVLANVHAILGACLSAYPEDDGFEHRGVSWLPLYHDMGLVGALLTALALPGPLALMSPELFIARPARWLQSISRHRATVSAAPHFAYALCLDRVRDDELEGVDLSCWRMALDGAEAVTPTTLERFYERFRHYGLREDALTPVYGLAEAGLAVTFSPPRRRFRVEDFEGRSMVSAGAPLPGFELRIASEGGSRAGRVLVRGPSIMKGYLGADEATRRVLVDGWLDTGDEGFLDDGELFLTGRDRDKVVLRGGNYAPELFEQALEGIAGVRAGGVVATSMVTDAGEELVILAESRSPEPEAVKSISAVLSEKTGFVPHRVVLLDPGSLPRTSSGKLRREEAARQFLRG
jgi:acyl-CoA synthetase (AMP-forming)/AMP-acid ligase II